MKERNDLAAGVLEVICRCMSMTLRGRRLQQGMLHIGLISENTRRPSALRTHMTHYKEVDLCGLVLLRLISKDSLAVAEEVAYS